MQVDAPLQAPPQITGDRSSDTLQIIYWIAGIAVPILAGYWGWKSKQAEKRASEDAIRHEQKAEREKAERETIAEHYRREAEQQAKFYDTILKEIEALREENRSLERRVMELQLEVKRLEEQLQYYERNPASNFARQLFAETMDSMATPAWIRDIGNNLWYLNLAYCKMFKIERQTFWTPVNIFGLYSIEDVMKYDENDRRVIESNVPQEFTERVRARIMDPNCEDFVTGVFRKTPIIVAERPFVFGCVKNIEAAL